MKKETKTIIIGTIITLLVLVIAFTIIYLIYNNNNKEENKENSNQNSSSTINTTENTSSNNDEDISLPNNTNSNSDSEKKQVTLYLFRGKGCHFCENAIEFLKSITNDYPYLEIKSYEVWNNKENKGLMDLVSQKLDIEIKSSVPLIIIGDDYAKRGFADGMTEGIIKEIEVSYNNSEYQDIVKQVLSENPELHVTEEIIK